MSLTAIDHALEALRTGAIDAAAFSRQVRSQSLPDALPPVFGQVLTDLLDRLESSAMFGGESCSFSQEDLLRHLDQWLVQARARASD